MGWSMQKMLAKVLCLCARGGRPPPPMRPNTHMGRGRAGRRVELWVPSAPHVGEMSRPGERWPIVLAMRNGEYYLTVVAALLTVGGTPSAIVAQFSRAYRHRCARSQALPHAPPRCWRREGAPSIDASSSEAHTWSCRLKAARHWSAERKRYHAKQRFASARTKSDASIRRKPRLKAERRARASTAEVEKAIVRG